MRLYDMINSIGSGHHAQSSAVGDLYVAIRIRTTLPHQIQQSSSNIMETPFAASGDFIVAVNVLGTSCHLGWIHYDHVSGFTSFGFGAIFYMQYQDL